MLQMYLLHCVNCNILFEDFVANIAISWIKFNSKLHFIESLVIHIICYKCSNSIIRNIFENFIDKIATDQILMW